MNPLEGTETFYLSLSNPNPTSSKTKDGPKYRVSFELSQEEWQMFMDTETAGMLIECACQVAHKNEEQTKRDPETVDALTGMTDKELKELRGGPLSQRSDSLAREYDFMRYVVAHDDDITDMGMMTPEDCREFIREYCNVDSRRYLDHFPEAGQRFKDLLSDYIRWCEEES